MDIKVLGIDLANNVFQLCALNQAGKVLFNRQVRRNKLRAAGASVWPTDEVLDCWTELVSGPLVIQRYMAERVVTVPVPPSLFTLFQPLRTRVYVERRDPPGAGARFGFRLESPKTQGAW